MAEVVVISAETFSLSAGPLYVSSLLIDHGYSVDTLQMLDEFSHDQIRQLVDKYIETPYQIIAVSLTFARSMRALQAISCFVNYARSKFPKIKIVCGGANNATDLAKVFPNDTLFLLGQNRENEIVQLFNRLTGKIKFLPHDFKERKIHYSKIFPKPIKGPIMFLEISKGCKFNCAFCTFSLRKNKSQFKTVEQVVEEMEEFHAFFGTNEVMLLCNTFNDDEDKIAMMLEASKRLSFVPSFYAFTRLDLFASQPDHVKAFYQKYVKYVFFGIESLNIPTLRAVHKSTNVQKLKDTLIDFKKNAREDVFIIGSFIVGLPFDSMETQLETKDWINESGIFDYIHFPYLTINTVKEENAETSEMEKDPAKYGYSHDKEPTCKFPNVKSLIPHYWVRDDGYDIGQAKIDSLTIHSMIRNDLPFEIQMLLSARDQVLPRGLVNYSKMQGDCRTFGIKQPEDVNAHPLVKSARAEINKFISEYFNALIEKPVYNKK